MVPLLGSRPKPLAKTGRINDNADRGTDELRTQHQPSCRLDQAGRCNSEAIILILDTMGREEYGT
jgi:hypothetical protein